MSEINDGGPAFPTEQGTDPHGHWNQTYCPGMTLRDWLAGQSNPDPQIEEYTTHVLLELMGKPKPTPSDWEASPVECLKYYAEVRARLRYMDADAMLVARAKR